MKAPNLFGYAKKELSQDAMICWLIAWSQTSPEDESGQALHDLGYTFVEELLRKHEVEIGRDIHCPEKSGNLDIHQQDNGIDVLARVRAAGTTHVLLIEDKTHTGVHGDQLNRYYEAVTEGTTKLDEVAEDDIRPIYLKTGNYSLAARKRIEGESEFSRFKVFDRSDFLRVLRTYRGTNPIVTDFRDHLEEHERDFNSWKGWRRNDDSNWSWSAWEGFYVRLEEEVRRKRGDVCRDGWHHVSNPMGGFLGFYWHFHDVESTEIYLQLEVLPGSNTRKLCFKVYAGPDKDDQRELKKKWHNRIMEAGKGKVEKPIRMRIGKWMTVAVWVGEWLAFNAEGALDVEGTIANLKEAERIVDEAVGE